MEKDRDEYELVPKAQLEYLRQQVEALKQHPFGDKEGAKDLLSSVNALNKNIEKLVGIFETASDEIVRDYKDQSNTEKLNAVMEQNEKLAKGIVRIADMMAEKSSPDSPVQSQPSQERQNPFMEQSRVQREFTPRKEYDPSIPPPPS